PARDGLRQVAEIIDRELLSGLTDLSLVAHGRPGALEFGAHALDAEGLATHAAVLAEIGAALAPAGAVRVYACDLASGRRLRIARADGPERVHGEWWRSEAEAGLVRDYY
ncbi:DUF4347 domain-containing protein, partial [Proteus mirabilis]|uniref:DUF4347 domain-containing protein n=1 Tax=Proteus mirabilis TaxID=584 RepID=UPI0013D248E6